jgi:hypothetical protein
MIVITGPEGSGHHLLQAIFVQHRCHGYFFVSLPSSRNWMDRRVGEKIGKNAVVGFFFSPEFLAMCNPSQILLLHREPYGCIYSAWKRFGSNKYELVPDFVQNHLMAITQQKVIATIYPEECAVWWFDEFIEAHRGQEIDGVVIKPRSDHWSQDKQFVKAITPYNKLLGEADKEWMKKLPNLPMV